MLIELNADLEWRRSIRPMEHTCLLREDFERPQLLALGLDHVHCLEGAVDHEETWLEAYQL